MVASGLLSSLDLFFLCVLPLQPHPHSWPYVPHCMATTQSASPAGDSFWSPNYYIQFSPEYLHLNVFHIYSKYLKLDHSSPLPKYSFIFLPYFRGGYLIYTQSPSFWSFDLQICHISLMDALLNLMRIKITRVGILSKMLILIQLLWGWTVCIFNNLPHGATQLILRSYFA